MKTAVFSLVISVSLLLAGEHQVDKNQNNMVKFISDAPIENFEGVTDKIDGYLYWQGEDFTSESQIYLEVDLNSLDTGIGLRNRHMRENYLETDKYPITYFQGKIISSSKNPEGSYTVEADGSIFIHGVNRPLKVHGSLNSVDKGYHIRAEFNVKLSDFDIEIPSIMFYKINEVMELKLDFYLK
jgi:polyisoprenoid-binding protein YceI